MKRYIPTLSISCLLFIVIPFSTQAQWEKVNNIPYPTAYFLDVFFLPSNPQYGWVCGFGGRVMRTINGGRTWAGTQITGADHLESVHFVNTNVGYCSGPAGLFRSTDGGANWREITPPNTPVTGGWGCYFANADVGVFLSGECAIGQYFYRTTDGGQNWNLFIGNESDSKLSDAYLVSPNGDGYAASSGRIWKTTDGGQTWSVFAATGSKVWHEEITVDGNPLASSMLVPVGGNSCSGGNGGGMRFTTNSGSSWNTFSTGRRMFGTYLVNSQTGWACGDNRSVYYTEDAGLNWELRNCGIESGDLDDIYFIDENTGWVVGQGVYRWVWPPYQIHGDTLEYEEVCIPDSTTDTVWVINKWDSPANATYTLGGTDAGDFRVLEPSTVFTIPACDSIPMVVRFVPGSGGAKTAAVDISLPDNQSLQLTLLGLAREALAAPEDTLLVINPAQVGEISYGTLRWTKEGSDAETIETIVRLTGSPLIFLDRNPPVVLGVGETDFQVGVQPNDTGWIEARYRFHVGPCDRDTFVTVRAYGVSPIITAPDRVVLNLSCVDRAVDSIPVVNTGNDTLIISAGRLSGDNAADFRIIGWVGGGGFPREIMPGDTAYLLVELAPDESGEKQADLQLDNNDVTTTRGVMSPWLVNLRGTALRPEFGVSHTLIDFGELCLGERFPDTTILVRGDVITDGRIESWRLAARPSPFRVIDPATGPLGLDAGTERELRIGFAPPGGGSFVDTLFIILQPCDTSLAVVLHGRALQAQSFVREDTIIIDPLAVDADLLAVTEIFNPGKSLENYRIDSIVGPLSARPLVDVQPVDLPAERNTPLRFRVSPQDTGWQEARVYMRMAPCDRDTIVTIRVYGVSPILDAPDDWFIALGQCRETGLDSLRISNTGNDILVLDSVSLGGPHRDEFRILGWSGGQDVPVRVAPGEGAWLLLEFEPAVAQERNAFLNIYHNDRRRSANLPNPFVIELSGERGFPILAATATVLDFDSLCIGETRVLSVNVENSGNVPARVAAPRTASDEFTAGVRGQSFPLLIPKDGGVVEFQVEYTARTPGRILDTLVIPIEPCGEQVLIALEGFGRQSGVVVSPDAIDNTIRSGETRDIPVSIEAIGNVPTELRTLRLVPARTDWELIAPATPYTMAPGEILNATLRLTPATDTVYQGSIQIDGDRACPFENPVPIDIRSVSTLLVVSQPAWNLGQVFCDEDPVETEITLSNFGSVFLTVDRLFLSDGGTKFQADIPPLPLTLQANDEYTLRLRCDVSEEGVYRDTLVIVSQAGEERIPLEVDVRKAEVRIVNPEILFDIVKMGRSSTRQLVIESEAERPVELIEFSNDKTGFSLEVQGGIIRPGTNSLPLTFKPVTEGKTASDLRIIVGRACPDTLFVSMSAIVPWDIEFRIGEYFAEAGDTVKMDLDVQGNLVGIAPDSVTIAIQYDKWLLSQHFAFIQVDGSPVPLPFEYSFQEGTIVVRLSQDDILNSPNLDSEGGTLFSFLSLAYASEPNSTPLFIQDSVFIETDEVVELRRRHGEFTVDHECNLVTRTLRLLATFNQSLAMANPSDGDIGVDIHSSRAQRVDIRLRDSFGRSVSTLLNVPLVEGQNHISFRTDTLPAGIYYFSTSSFLKTETLKVVLMK